MKKVREGNSSIKNYIPGRRSQKSRDKIYRTEKSIDQDKKKRKQLKYDLANVKDPEMKKELKRKERVTRKRIRRKKKEIHSQKQIDSEAKMVSRKTHSNHEDSEKLVLLVHERGYFVDEIDWEELKGADLSFEHKKSLLFDQIDENDD